LRSEYDQIFPLKFVRALYTGVDESHF